MSERGFAIVCEGNVRLRIGVRRLIFCDFAVKELSDDPEDAYEAIVSKTLQASQERSYVERMQRATCAFAKRLVELIGIGPTTS